MLLKNKFLVVIFFVIFISTNFLFAESKSKQIYQSSKRFAEVLSLIQTSFVEEENIDDLVDLAIDKMLEGLNEEFVYVLSKEDYEAFVAETQGFFVGIGIRYSVLNNQAVIVDVIDKTPALKAGLLVGDLIVQIDDLKLEKPADFVKISNKIRGKKGSKVKITIRRNDETKTFQIKREKVDFASVESKMLDENLGIGYLKISEFGLKTFQEFDDQYKDLISKNMKAVIVDLRNNPGGVMEEAVDVLKKFFGNSRMILQTKARSIFLENTYLANEALPEYEKIQMVILVNKYTVSAAEIFAGVMQDLGYATILGEKTFGKGTVQIIFELEDGRGLSLTTARYYLPSGTNVNKIGVFPNVSVEDKYVLDYAINLLEEYLKEKINE